MNFLDKIYYTDKTINIADIDFIPHPSFKGVYTKKLIENGIKMLLVHLEKNAVMESHIHENNDEIHFIISGHGDFTLGNQKLKYSKGMMALIPKNTPHSIIAKDELYLLATFI